MKTMFAALLALGLAVTPSSAGPGPQVRKISAEGATTLMAWHRGRRHGRHRHRFVRRRHAYVRYDAVPLWTWCYRYIGWDGRAHKICSDRPYAWPY